MNFRIVVVVIAYMYTQGTHKLSRSDEHFMKFLPIDWVYWRWEFRVMLFFFLFGVNILCALLRFTWLSIYIKIDSLVLHALTIRVCINFRLRPFPFWRCSSHTQTHKHTLTRCKPETSEVRERKTDRMSIASCRKNRAIFVERKIFHITRH